MRQRRRLGDRTRALLACVGLVLAVAGAAMLLPLLPRYHAEGKSYFTIGVGCTGGRHRSVFVAEELAARLTAAGWPARPLHRELRAAGLTGDLT
mgnify:CR=1 FL=1